MLEANLDVRLGRSFVVPCEESCVQLIRRFDSEDEKRDSSDAEDSVTDGRRVGRAAIGSSKRLCSEYTRVWLR